MKRNMDLILDILLFIEKHCNGIHDVPLQKDFLHSDDESEIMEHCRLIVEKNLATAQLFESGYEFHALTWDGHDFLDNARNSEVWNATKNAAGNLSFGVFQKVLEATAISYALSLIKGVF